MKEIRVAPLGQKWGGLATHFWPRVVGTTLMADLGVVEPPPWPKPFFFFFFCFFGLWGVVGPPLRAKGWLRMGDVLSYIKDLFGCIKLY
jgi:hypothetical protein